MRISYAALLEGGGATSVDCPIHFGGTGVLLT